MSTSASTWCAILWICTSSLLHSMHLLRTTCYAVTMLAVCAGHGSVGPCQRAMFGRQHRHPPPLPRTTWPLTFSLLAHSTTRRLSALMTYDDVLGCAEHVQAVIHRYSHDQGGQPSLSASQSWCPAWSSSVARLASAYYHGQEDHPPVSPQWAHVVNNDPDVGDLLKVSHAWHVPGSCADTMQLDHLL